MKKFILFIIILVLLIGGFFIMNRSNNIALASASSDLNKSKNEIVKKDKDEDKNETTKIKVDIKGSVVSPDVYEVDINSRIIDIINIAGGLTESADTDSINLSKKVKDEDVIIIYSQEEMENNKKSYEEKIEYCKNDNNVACATDVVTFEEESMESDNNGVININTANVEDFMKLSGIGEAKAKKIIEYRDSIGSFNSIEDIMNVSGIGDNIFDKIKDYITI